MNPGEIFAFYLNSLPGEPTMEKMKKDGAGGYLYPRPVWGAKFDIHNPKEKKLYNENMPGETHGEKSRFIIFYVFFSESDPHQQDAARTDDAG